MVKTVVLNIGNFTKIYDRKLGFFNPFSGGVLNMGEIIDSTPRVEQFKNI